MNFERTEDCTIFYLKFLQTMLCQEDISAFLKEVEEFGVSTSSIALLELLKELIYQYTQSTSLPEEVVKNVYYFVNEHRFQEEQEGRKERCEVCNEIINLLNRSTSFPAFPFYQSLVNRYYTSPLQRLNEHLSLITEPGRVKRDMSNFTAYEYLIFLSHTYLVSEEEFLLNDVYLVCIPILLSEIPKLKDDVVFQRRVNYVLKCNEALSAIEKGAEDEAFPYELDAGDEAILHNKMFWKLHRKLKTKMKRYRKDS